jgi:hypothetical protein
MSMKEIIVPETGLPLKFPDYREAIRADAEAFRRLSPQERIRHIDDLFRTALHLARISPNREANERLYLESEANWRRIQRELFEHERTSGRSPVDVD